MLHPLWAFQNDNEKQQGNEQTIQNITKTSKTMEDESYNS